ncbi:hypothetical protein J914_3911 [Acinetobacter baumannii 25493_1]|uniref:hypothetical protein n=1 Tax=Acinetobacter baumannii TaxID=470 RepID=UPI000448633F|nr:hypothetical protein [Acinetobacter baumannii]EXH05646.1 hypothetical protein J641_4008 [Acinetobacter baumannii 1188188]EXI00616.1 hypothetical protein J644_3831 [Acinetobacter baumannii 480175]EYD56520.1 hypothetical protein J914_3911 [Acinetobacter baumannii 25493_1]EYD62994.1 hypothetical protein J923_3788 [Acinetobacter baumannii 25493_10]KCX81925.1 hypothetical protein J532_3730 [Acinetobacter baumannii 940793]
MKTNLAHKQEEDNVITLHPSTAKKKERQAMSEKFDKGYVMSSRLYRNEVKPFLGDAARNVYAELEEYISGFNKESDFVSYSQLQGRKIEGLEEHVRKLSTATVRAGLKQLIEYGVISIVATNPKLGNKYKLNEISLVEHFSNKSTLETKALQKLNSTTLETKALQKLNSTTLETKALQKLNSTTLETKALQKLNSTTLETKALQKLNSTTLETKALQKLNSTTLETKALQKLNSTTLETKALQKLNSTTLETKAQGTLETKDTIDIIYRYLIIDNLFNSLRSNKPLEASFYVYQETQKQIILEQQKLEAEQKAKAEKERKDKVRKLSFDEVIKLTKNTFANLCDLELWEQYVANRSQQAKSKLTKNALNTIYKDFLQWGYEGSNQSLKTSITGNYQGLFAPKQSASTYQSKASQQAQTMKKHDDFFAQFGIGANNELVDVFPDQTLLEVK